MQRIKHHYCWVKAAHVPADAEPPIQASSAGASAALAPTAMQIGLPDVPADVSTLPATPAAGARTAGWLFSATGHFRSLLPTPWPPVQPEDVNLLHVLPASATGTFKALAATPVPALSASDLARAQPLSATGHFRVLSDAPLPAIKAEALSATGEAQVPDATAPLVALSGEMFAPPLMFAGATFMGAWQVENHPSASVALSFMPIVGSRQDALLWRDSPQGQEWAKEALAITLLSFAAIGEI